DVFAEQADRTGVPVRVRRPAGVFAVGDHGAEVAEERGLALGTVARQEAVAGALLVAGAGADAEAQAGEGAVAALPRLEEQPAGELELAIGIAGRAVAPVRGAVVHADHVVHPRIRQRALQLHAEV